KGSRSGFAALQLADYVEGELEYAGRAGTGFTGKELAAHRREFEGAIRKTPPCNGPLAWPSGEKPPARRVIPDAKGTTWLEPRSVCEVRFMEWTEEGLLREPVFLRFRDDKKPEECARQAAGERGAAEEADDPPASRAERPP